MKKWETTFKNIRRKGGSDVFDQTKRYTLVCEFHFPMQDIILHEGSGRKTLKADAVPSIFAQKEKNVKKHLGRRQNCDRYWKNQAAARFGLILTRMNSA